MGNRGSSVFKSFFRWWSAELAAIFANGRKSVKHRAGKRLVLCMEDGRRRLIRENGERRETLAETDKSGPEGLGELAVAAMAYPKLPFGIRFGSRDCFSRMVELPAQAEGDFRRILELDMERATPFRAGDVFTAHYIAPGAQPGRGKCNVRHLVVKRRTVEPLLNELRGIGLKPSFADCWDETNERGLPVNFLASEDPADRGKKSPLPVLGGLAAALAATAVVIVFVRYETALAELKDQVSAAKSEAAAVRLAVQASQIAKSRLTALGKLVTSRQSTAGILDELTKYLPDGAWVSDLRIDGKVIEFTGFASSAASLVPLLEKSASFTDVSLISPVIFDDEQDRERFSLRMQLAGPSENQLDAETGALPQAGSAL